MIGQAPNPEEPMSTCRFMFDNFITGPQALGVSSARPGMVGSAAAEALGSATCLAAGEHTGDLDQVLVVEIDSVEAGTEVGLATFRWKRESAGSWEASGLLTSVNQTSLADGVSVKWVPGPGQEFYKGDRWSVLAAGCQGPQALMDRDRDTGWRSLEAAEQFIEVDLGQAQPVRAMALADHNLSETATVTLKATDTPEPSAPIWRFDPAEGLLVDRLGQAGSNTRSTGRTYIDGGVLGYAAAGESCFEDGKLSIEPEGTNLLPYSRQFNQNPPWFTGRLNVATAAGAAPDGAITANLLAETADSGEHYFGTNGLTGLADDTVHAWSIFAKPNGRTWCLLTCRTKADVIVRTYFNLSGAGEVGAQGHSQAGITRLGSTDWYRIWVSHDMAGGGTLPQVYFGLGEADADNNYLGDGISGTYAWGAQLEVGRVPTAYIPTTSGTAYRARDGVSFPLPQALRDILSTAEGPATAAGAMLVNEWTPAYSWSDITPGYQGIISVVNSIGSLLYIGTPGTGAYYAVAYDGSNAANVVTNWAAGQSYTFALRWDDGPGSAQVGDKLSATSTWTWGGAKAFDGAFVLGTRLYIGYAASYPFKVGSIKFYDSWLADPLEKTLSPWDYPEYSQALSITSPHLVHFLDQAHRFWRLELDDPDNPEGMLRASLIYLGDSFQPQRTFRAGYGQGSVATRTLVTSSGGKLAGSSGAVAAYYQLEFSRLDDADVARFEAMLAAVHAGGDGGLRPLFFTPFTDDPGQTLYCLPGAELSRQAAPGGRWDLGLRLEEVVKSDA